MATYTPNINLLLAQVSDQMDLTALVNPNWSTLDSKIKDIDASLATKATNDALNSLTEIKTNYTDFWTNINDAGYNETGFCQIPNGLYIEWGINNVIANMPFLVTFPLSFPHNVSVVVATPSWTSDTNCSVVVQDSNHWQMNLISNTTVQIKWIAIGH
jgi:hypothetical protein